MKGKLIVIEGSDGSGKTTQLSLLKNYLEEKKVSVATIDFPRYYDSFYGKFIGRFLKGEFGSLESVNPYLISIPYALDRASVSEKMHSWLNSGKIVLTNRYSISNLAHQTPRLSKNKRKEFTEWLKELEYSINKIPQEDVVVFLYVPYKISIKLMSNKDRAQRAYTKGEKKDIVEKNIEYLKNSEKAYLNLAKKNKNWIKINCINKKGELKTKEEIHEEIKKELGKKKILFFK